MSPLARFRPPEPKNRYLKVFAFDPSLDLSLDTAVINQLTVSVPWERDLAPGPVGEYLEIVDIDPASGLFYPPVDLNDAYLLVQDGLVPSEGTPQFHQQMVYAIASRTIRNFEDALGRSILWAPRYHLDAQTGEPREDFIQRLRIYPHALRQANAYYAAGKKALLFGYFPAAIDSSGNNLPGGLVFTCLSHDIIAHETTHAILDGLHPYFAEPSNQDVLALHEAFADLVALFQHFSYPEILRHQIARTRGDLSSENLLAELAQQFGQATGKRGALRSAIGHIDPQSKEWIRTKADATALQTAVEPHQRGAILVAAVFDAFLTVYKHRVADLMRIATGGSGVLPAGALHPDLVNRLAEEAAQMARHILTMCIRALDYCPPVDITFGEFLRALVTADYDISPIDRDGYRIAMIESFRRHGIYPANVRSLSEESLLWSTPDDEVLQKFFNFPRMREIRRYETMQKYESDKRSETFKLNQIFRNKFRQWFLDDLSHDLLEQWKRPDVVDLRLRDTLRLRLFPDKRIQSIPTMAWGEGETRPNLDVNSVRLAYRVGPGGFTRTDLVVEITQYRLGYLDGQIQDAVDAGEIKPPPCQFVFRGGATLLIDLETGRVRYVMSKAVASRGRLEAMRRFLTSSMPGRAEVYFGDPNLNYFRSDGTKTEIFALLHGADELQPDW